MSHTFGNKVKTPYLHVYTEFHFSLYPQLMDFSKQNVLNISKTYEKKLFWKTIRTGRLKVLKYLNFVILYENEKIMCTFYLLLIYRCVLWCGGMHYSTCNGVMVPPNVYVIV